MNKIFRQISLQNKKRQLLEIVIFMALFYCAVMPVRVYLCLFAGLVLFSQWRKFWLPLSFLLTAYGFLLFSPFLIQLMSSVCGKSMQLFVPQPELIKEAKVDEPVISIVIPAYNYDQYVEKAIVTAATQLFPLPYEVVVLDDASKDKTLDVILRTARRFPHVAVYHNRSNQGLITTKNSAVGLARGKWIYNLDADDYLDLNALNTLYSVALFDDVSGVFGAQYMFLNSHKAASSHPINLMCGGSYSLNYNCIPNSIMYQKSDWEKFGKYSYLFSGMAEDWDFGLNFFAQNKKFSGIQKLVYYYRVKGQGRDFTARQLYDESQYWWIIQAKYAQLLSWKQRVEMLVCGFFRFYCSKARKNRLDSFVIPFLYKNRVADVQEKLLY